ncbi:TorF family putative porin [Tsuneonella sp. CC-YZS046]|uniref:TorF family putative porin n=1 Tax=Tsuneonella sp. CC-YZS046 TaxID=3042152 RepID=UPI002D791E43|nr:TorF family putative porin [Tsuneonella sp. CC-YZS046]WRO66519.1 TorF family putative porin [Tsuneonella sp. CC-YZS046]
MRFLRHCPAGIAWAAAAFVPLDMVHASPAETGDHASEVSDEFQIVAEAMLLSDYRFRGVSYSHGSPVAQGMVSLVHESGFYGGIFASSLGNHDYYGAVEVDLFAGWAGTVAPGIAADLTLLYYYYPDASASISPRPHSFEAAAQFSGNVGPVQPTVGIWYAWEQEPLGGRDNLYLFSDVVAGIPKTPLSVKLHGGYTRGAYSLASGRKTFDWSAGLMFDAGSGVHLGIDYIGMSGPKLDDYTDDTVMVGLAVQF